MNEPLDEIYLRWLYAQIGNVRHRNPQLTYWALARQMYAKEFVWFTPNDDNRCEDGLDIRHEFAAEYHMDVDELWLTMGCSFLEMLIGLSRRLAFEDDREPRGWFWRLIENLDLEEFTDRNYNPRAVSRVDEVMDTVIWRTYHHDGRGGLFPLEHPTADQRDVEIWYQLCAYLLEHE